MSADVRLAARRFCSSDFVEITIKDNSSSHFIVSLNVPHVALTNLCICCWTVSYNCVKRVTSINSMKCILKHIRRPRWYK